MTAVGVDTGTGTGKAVEAVKESIRNLRKPVLLRPEI